MQYYVTRSGLEIFDTCRAYGLAQLLHALTGGKMVPTITDAGRAFCVAVPDKAHIGVLARSDAWHAVVAQDNWQRVFLTYKKQWTSQRDKARKILETNVPQILATAAAGVTVDFDGSCTLPGAMDPLAFKGLKGLTSGSYSEGPTTADEWNWALGCLGAVVAQRYKLQKVTGNKWEYYVTLPVPQELRFADFHEVRQLVYERGLRYNGVRNAAAHFCLLLADAIREKAQGNPIFPLRFSTVLYFSLFQSGQQFKPSVGGSLQLGKLIDAALRRPGHALEMFRTWEYLFRRGSPKGCEDLSGAITELVLAPSLDTYYRHVRIFTRYIVDPKKRVKREFLYEENALREVITYVE